MGTVPATPALQNKTDDGNKLEPFQGFTAMRAMGAAADNLFTEKEAVRIVPDRHHVDETAESGPQKEKEDAHV